MTSSTATALLEVSSRKVHQVESRACQRKVPHVRQSYNWDCGLACVLMIVHANGMKHVDLKYLRELCGTTSIWTVDIAHLLRHFHLKVKFYTVTLGANPAYADEKFYKEHMQADAHRVQQLFKLAQEAGIELCQRSLGLQELKEVVSTRNNLVLILVDKHRLSIPLCCPMLSHSTTYVGHYVLLVDYNYDKSSFSMKDPASYKSTVEVKDSTLEEARKSFGTDEDVIIVELN